MASKITLKSKLLLNKKFSDQFGANFSFTIMGIGHLFSLVNFFIATFLQALYLVTQKVFFQNHYMDSPIRGKVPLVNIVPHVVLHQKMHVLLSGDF